jgi:hypothetical protein
VGETSSVRTQSFFYSKTKYLGWNLAYVFKYTYWKISLASLALGGGLYIAGNNLMSAAIVTVAYLVGFAALLAIVVVVKLSTPYAREMFSRSRYAEISERGIFVSADNGSESRIAWSDLHSVNWKQDVVIVRLSSRQGFFIPTAAFASPEGLADARRITKQFSS